MEPVNEADKGMYEILDELCNFQHWVNGEEFQMIWKDKHMADHLWGKFHGFNHDILRLWGALDSNNMQILAHYVMKRVLEKRKVYAKEVTDAEVAALML